MEHKPRIETQDAKELRRGRQAFAAPGGIHDGLVRFLGAALPIGVGIVAALMVITPLSPRGEISFLLDRDEVAQIEERLRVDNALYRGTDKQGRPFSLTAHEAVQISSSEGVVRLRDVVARIMLNEGPAQLTAQGGAYSLESEIMRVEGPLQVTAADGYRIVANGVSIDLANKRMTGTNGVEGAIPAGTFSADRLEADLEARVVALDGHARLRMVPGQVNQSIRIPQ